MMRNACALMKIRVEISEADYKWTKSQRPDVGAALSELIAAGIARRKAKEAAPGSRITDALFDLFLEESCDVASHAVVGKALLRQAFTAWQSRHGFLPANLAFVRRNMVRHGFTEFRPTRTGPWAWSGLALKPAL